MTESLRFEGKIMSGRVKEHSGCWFITIAVDVMDQPKADRNASVGIDFGLKTFATLSDGGKRDIQAYYRQAENKLAQLERSLCRKKPGSKNRMKANKRVAKVHDRVTNLRQNMIHEFTTQVVEGHGIICIEDLNLKGLVQTRWAKSFSDVAIGETIR